jgi:hypothetical protein
MMRVFLLAAVALVVLAPTAAASRTQFSILQDDKLLVRDGDGVRDQKLDELKALGVDAVKITIEWRDVAPGGASRPSGFDATNPASYPRAKWAPYDAVIAGAKSRGLEVLIMISGPAPDWASAAGSSPAGVERPDPAEFGAFVRAVGTRYSGSYDPSAPGGGGSSPAPPSEPGPLPIPPQVSGAAQAAQAQAQPLPRVTLWSVWNEPNLPRFLLPQRDRRGTPTSPHIYRRLYLAAYDALGATGHGGDTILFGELLPVGKSSRGTRSSISPLDFLRELACVDGRLRRFRGSASRTRGCDSFQPLPGTGLAFHPYTLAGGPRVRPRSRDDASIGTLSRLTSLLDALGRRKRLAGGRGIPLYLTEFGFQTDPPDLFGAPIKRVPAYMGESEYLAYRNARVLSYSQYPLVDDRGGSGANSTAGFQSGLRFADGREKPGVYTAFELPFFVRHVSRSSVEVFGAVRAAEPGGGVVIESRRGGGSWRRLGTARLGERGYFRKRFGARGTREFRFKAGSRTSNAIRG